MSYVKVDKLISGEYSKFKLLDEIYENKKAYYKGEPTISDSQYDAIENSFVAIHGKDTLLEWGCVGYEPTMHQEIKKHLLLAQIKFLQLLKDEGIRTPELEDKIKEYQDKYGETT